MRVGEQQRIVALVLWALVFVLDLYEWMLIF